MVLTNDAKQFFHFFLLVYCRKPYPLGLGSQRKNIPDSSIEVTSEAADQFNHAHARLRDQESWCGKNAPGQAISVDMGMLVSVSGVATQEFSFGRVTEYKIRYSYDGMSWYGYPSDTSLKVRALYLFCGSVGFETIVNDPENKLYNLLPPVNSSELCLRERRKFQIANFKTKRFKNDFIICNSSKFLIVPN